VTIRLARRLSAVQPSATLAMSARAAEMKAAGIDVLSFAAGEPDFATPEHIRQAAARGAEAGQTKYTAVCGMPALRKAIARRVADTTGAPCGPENVVVTAGAKQALFNAAFSLYEEGDEVIVPAPYWVTYPEQVRMAAATPVFVETREEQGFLMSPAALQAALTKRTRAVILCTPSNPTGAAYDGRRLAAIAEVLEPTDAWLISDEIYSALTYGGFRHESVLSAAPKLRDRTVLIDGVSKTWSMTGWRVGWSVAPKALSDAMDTVQGQVSSNASSISQAAALAALDGDQACVEEMRLAFERRSGLIVEGLSAIPGVRCFAPRGAFYVFPSFHGVLARGDVRAKDSTSLAMYLLETARVATVPGAAFGAEGHLRLSYACGDDTIREGVSRIAAAVAKLR